jgi:hypothetical protein
MGEEFSRAVAGQVPECFVEDVLGPFRLYQASPADADQQVPRVLPYIALAS